MLRQFLLCLCNHCLKCIFTDAGISDKYNVELFIKHLFNDAGEEISHVIFFQYIIAAVVQVDFQAILLQLHLSAVNKAVYHRHFPFQKYHQIRKISHGEQFRRIARMQADTVDFQANFQLVFQRQQILHRHQLRECNIKRYFRQIFRIGHPF